MSNRQEQQLIKPLRAAAKLKLLFDKPASALSSLLFILLLNLNYQMYQLKTD
jgi:hypothetical protein